MDESLPYRVCYSNGEEKCQKCGHQINTDYLQIAVMIQVNDFQRDFGRLLNFSLETNDIRMKWT